MKQFFSAILLCLAGLPVWAQGGLSVSPSKLYYSMRDGRSNLQKITLYNPSNEPIVLKSSLKDWTRDSLGIKVYSEAGTLPSSNAAWVSVNPQVVEIGPGQSKDVEVSIYTPDGALAAAAVRNSMLFFTQVKEQKAAARVAGKLTNINIMFEVGIHIYSIPESFSESNIDISNFRVRSGQEGGQAHKTMVLTLKNSERLPADGQIAIELTDKTSGEELKLPARMVSLLPEAELQVEMDIPGNFAGKKLLAVALLDQGANKEVKVAQKTIEAGQ